MKTLIFFSFLISSAMASTNHNIKVEISPEGHSLTVIDQMTLASRDCSVPVRFNLHEGLNPLIISPSQTELKLISKSYEDKDQELGVEHYEFSLPCGQNQITLSYAGTIFHKVKDPTDPYSRGTSDSPGLISEEGVVLSSSTFWYPQMENAKDNFVTFRIDVSNNKNFRFMSTGEKLSDSSFSETTPQEDIYLIGAAFSVYEKAATNGIALSAYLRTPDEEMANKYLGVTEGYLNRYSTLVGPYPYKKFDLVENFWDTGFGMPSFTLLGSNIIRLPFIINTSYPHEVLHDWWGNSVYVDYSRGNWCEGITAYMADHLMAELSGAGDNYRRDTLQKFTDFVTERNDFPLTKFLNRINAPTEAIGYGKALMFFHMMRVKLGDAVFKKGFNHFYLNNRFKKVSYAEIQKSLEVASGKNLADDFAQWTKRTGAPTLKIAEATVSALQNGYRLHIKLTQVQTENVFAIKIPLAVTLEGETAAIQSEVEMKDRELSLDLDFAKRPVFLQVDPEFDLMRRLAKDEVPAVLTMALGAPKTYFVISEKSSAEAQKKFIDILSQALPKEGSYEVISDSDVSTLPAGSSVWILGKENKLVSSFNDSVKDKGTIVGSNDIQVSGQTSTVTNNSFTLVSRDLKTQNVMVFVSASDANSYEILANKLIHYGKYSYLVFAGESLTNKQKGVWKLSSSSMSVALSLNARPGTLKHRGALVNE